LLLVLLSAPYVPAAPAPLPKPERHDARTDLGKLQGEWEFVREVRFPGRHGSTYGRYGLVLAVLGNHWVIRRGPPAALGTSKHRIWLDPSGSPRSVDFVCEETGDLRKGVYKLEGDALSLRVAMKGEPRPSSLGGPGTATFARKKAR
jgi:uncharacterized protein (TIGR03067 family)